jgi:prolyl 4-hydroxylase
MLTAIVRVVDRIATIKYNFDCGNNLKFYSMNSLTAQMDPYIYINKRSLSPELCKDIIEIYEKTQNKHRATTLGGINENILNAMQCYIDNITDKDWPVIHEFLQKELTQNVLKYMKTLDDRIGDGNKYKHITDDIIYNDFHINKYECKNEGKYEYHIDRYLSKGMDQERHITFIWYLNDVTEGGETEMNGNIIIKPESGKLLLFPSTWTYPHCSRKTISNDKYVIVGWLMRRLK